MRGESGVLSPVDSLVTAAVAVMRERHPALTDSGVGNLGGG